MVKELDAAPSSTRARTRRAILDAGVSILSQQSGASLAEVASAAGVGRTTMHRYFPERADLIAGITADLVEQIASATERARPQDGPALAALERVCQAYFALGDGPMLMLSEPQLFGPPEDHMSESDRAVLELVRRGHAEGTMDPDLTPEWILSVLWSLLFSTWLHTREDDVPEHDALALCLRTLRKAVAA
ncbi:TetR/AcrR family transcriptional regulator [Pseudonocardia kunmingensis]|uniref:TetR family transcriptional regulator n=1 Tax=Pseudonocardia kunmingensis TaxID=630975 RepID=A0A543DIQ2_9PSEU|nr:TetR/AcrR family transcriptional regulator [Pseudonocardia kunmingensis]TQM09193.1 TetR family transcriptional regulator [Pseudonocardia kunmingensis]